MSHPSLSPPRPALEALIGSYNRWKGDLDRMIPFPPRSENESFEDYAKKHKLPPPPKSFVFIASLPTVSVAELPAGEMNCSICFSSFIGASFIGANAREDDVEKPTRLPCGHIIGNRCLRKWVYPYGFGESCPICRAACLLENIGLNSETLVYEDNDGLETSIDEEVWADHEGGSPLSDSRKSSIRKMRYCLLERRVEAARDELDRDLKDLETSRSGKSQLRRNEVDTYDKWRDTRARWERRKRAIDGITEELIDGLDAFQDDVEFGRREGDSGLEVAQNAALD